MNLSDYEFFPGSIINVDDPKYLGRVKATVPTVFDTSMTEDGLPWIYPFTMAGYQRFSKMHKGSKIWVLRNKNNHTEFWYIPMFELTEDTRGLINNDTNYEDGEVLLSRNMGGTSVYIYYNASDGIVIKYGNNNMITINPDSEVIMQGGSGKVKISDNHVYVGDGNTGEPAVMGNQLVNILTTLAENLSALGSTASPNPFTLPLGPGFFKAAGDITAGLGTLLANNTNVD